MGDKGVIELITCDSGDWEVLRVNGEVFEEGHSIPSFIWIRLLNDFDIESEETSISDDEMERGMY